MLSAYPALIELAGLLEQYRAQYRRQAQAGYPYSAEGVQADYAATVKCYAEALPIWTTGYAAWASFEAFRSAWRRFEPVLLDVRKAPYSKMPQWTQEHLQSVFGASYVHVPEWGNEEYKRGSIEIANFEGGLRRLVQLTPTRPVLVMCGCKDYSSCHRAVLADMLRARGFSVQEYSIAVEETQRQSARVSYWELSSSERQRVKREYQAALKEKEMAA